MDKSLLEGLKDLKILVIGDLMIDHYMWGKFERISPEAPVPIVDITKEEVTLGGAGNVLKNLKSFGIRSDVVSVIGDDTSANELCTLLTDSQVDLKGVHREPNRITSKKSRILASKHQMMRVDKESKAAINEVSENFIISYVKANIAAYKVVLISDYLKGTLTGRVLNEIIACARQNNVTTIIDPKGNNYAKYAGANIIKPNKKEAAIATGIEITDKESLKKAAQALQKQTDCDTIVITLSEEGMAICSDHFEIIPTKASEVFDVTGAGDTVLASIGICVAVGMDIKDACVFANHAAAIVVSKIGSAVTTIDAVLDHMNEVL
jgi:rfaE bifunctional protein kinase chain/domain